MHSLQPHGWKMKQTHSDRLYFGQDLFRFTRSFPIIPADTEKLRQHNLPILQTEEEMANWLGISLQRLRWFTHDRLNDTIWHYRRHVIPKRNGGTRVILAPKRELKGLQRTILWGLIYRLFLTLGA